MCQDTNLFIELLEPHYNDALKYCKALCARRSSEDAQDVLQQSFLKALENFEKLEDKEKFRAWFFTILTREFYNSIRKDFWKKFLPIEMSADIDKMPDVFEENNNSENKEKLLIALSKISSKERAAILLFEIAGFSIEEIKQIQKEVSVSAVKSRLSRTRKKLKALIESYGQDKGNVKQNSPTKTGDINNETLRLIRELQAK